MDYQLVKGQVVRAQQKHISVRVSGASKLDLVLRGQEDAFWELGFSWWQNNISSHGAVRNEAQVQPNLRSGHM